MDVVSRIALLLLLLFPDLGLARPRPPLPPLRPGDLLVATERPGLGPRVAISRYRVGGGPDTRVQTEEILLLPGSAAGLSVSSDGRLLAIERVVGVGHHVALYILHEKAPELIWQSPEGCGGPAVAPAGRVVAVACPGGTREPASILRYDVQDRSSLRLVGEWPRSLPVWDGGGTLHWIEESPTSVTLLRHDHGGAFPIHVLQDPVAGLWPQIDGSWLAELRVPGTRREFTRMLRAGHSRPESVLVAQWPPLEDSDPVIVGRSGEVVLAHCGRSASQVLRAYRGEDLPPISLPGEPQAAAIVPGWPSPPKDDLATAGPSVLRRAQAADLEILGVALGMSLEQAWSELDRGTRHPYWMPPRVGRRPSGIGVGAASGGWCVEYDADEHGLIEQITARSCASAWLSPALEPLFELPATPGAVLALARRWLGPGVAAWIEPDRLASHPAGRPVIRRVHVEWNVAERGLALEVSAELIEGVRRPLGGDVALRLSIPPRPRVAGP